jgi:predicted transcriptional regulator
VLTASEPRGREELESAVNVSHVSLVRNLDGLEERGWIVADGRQYRITPWGEMVVADLDRLLDTAEVTRTLSEVLGPLPGAQFDAEMEWFRDATVVRAEGADPLRPVRRWETVIRDASLDRLRIALGAIIPRTLRLAGEEQRDHACAFVFDQKAMRFVTGEADLRPRLVDVLEAGHDVYCYDGDLAFNLAVADGPVLLGFDHEDGGPRALIESEDDRVREWATAQFAEDRSAATGIEPDALSTV